MSVLLVKHLHAIRKLATFHSDGVIARRAAELLNMYMSCRKTDHKCKVLGTMDKLKMLRYVSFLLIDIIGDLIVGVKTIRAGAAFEGWMLLFFSFAPLFYLNMLAILNFNKMNQRYYNTDCVKSLDGNSPGQRLRHSIPWEFASMQKVILNCLNIIQLHPIITAIRHKYTILFPATYG